MFNSSLARGGTARFDRLLLLALLAGLASLASLQACASAPRSRAQPRAADLRVPSAPVADRNALALAQLLPGGERCTVALPVRVPPAARALVALVSQTEPLPWSLSLEVLAYARTERSPTAGQRAVVELVRFRAADRSAIEASLAQALARPLHWSDATPRSEHDSCDGELTCRPLLARFVDPRTVQLSQGQWDTETGSSSACLAELARAPDAIELSARSALLAGTALRDSSALLRLRQDGVERVTDKRYASPEDAARALRELQLGHGELASLAGVTASSLGERTGERLSQATFARFDDLRLALEDRTRASELLQRPPPGPPIEQVDPRDADAVRALADAQLAAKDSSMADLRALSRLLERARALHPDDAGLARRHHQLASARLGDAQLALSIALAARARKLDDVLDWPLRVRAALARLDEARLRTELAAAHGLTTQQASGMARELVQQVQSGRDYERAEWAFLAATRLARDSRRLARSAVARRLPLVELPRLLAYLAQSDKPQLELGVHVLLQAAQTRASELAQAELAQVERAPLWMTDTHGGGRLGVMLAATSGDDAALRALGRALVQRSDDGALTLVMGLEAIGTRASTTLMVAGRREGSELVIDQLSPALARLPWSRVERLLAAPLRLLVGASFPPDELAIESSDAQEAAHISRAAQHAGAIECASDQAMVRCHGPLSDASAARRALLSVSAALLGDALHALWSSPD